MLRVQPAGDRGVAFWDRYIRRMHGTLDTWNQFMHYKFTFYAPELDAHILWLAEVSIEYGIRNVVDHATIDDLASP